MEARPLVYDASHLATRLGAAGAAGIDWIDRAYARHFAARIACGVHYGLSRPHVLAPARVAEISSFHERGFEAFAAGRDLGWPALRAWLTGEIVNAPPQARRGRGIGWRLEATTLKLRARLAHDPPGEIPHGAVYVNVAQYGLEHDWLFRWLDTRPDVSPVFFLHDVLPLDYPEYFRDGYEKVFRARFETIVRRAGAIVTTTQCTAQRIGAEFARMGHAAPPILARAPPSPLEQGASDDARDAALAGAGYFVVVATVEPRKNHLLLLNVWRRLAETLGNRTPKLVCVGQRGWQNAEVLALLDRSAALAPHVRSVGGLSSATLRRLLQNARALLLPSFCEGYGIPLAEALTVGLPVICSDIPVFREATQGRAAFLSPLDGLAWRDAVQDFAADTPRRAAGLEQAAGYDASNWTDYFEGVEGFLREL